MAKRSWKSSCLCLLLSSVIVSLQHLADATVPAIFILGDSTVDVGTNNFFSGSPVARANFPNNGIDFPNSIPTGRFSNGYNTADFLASLMGHVMSPAPFLSLLNNTADLRQQIVRGVNFASGGSGLLDITGQKYKVISLSQQIQQFATVRSNLTELMGPKATKSLLSKSFFLISTGSNDIFEYFEHGASNKEEFINTLKLKYEKHLKSLFNLGARKFGIVSVGTIGCCPGVRARNPTGDCLEDMNEYARTFFLTTQDLLQTLSSELKGMKFSLGNTYEMTKNILDNPLLSGFGNIRNACCGSGFLNGENECFSNSNLCSNREKYVFWDWFHPTEATSHLQALALFGGPPSFVAPINFGLLAVANC